MKKILCLLLMLSISGTYAQNLNIPDANFKSFLLADVSINTNNDTEIQVSEANAYSGSIDCQYEYINDLTGIEAFTSLVSLNCSNNTMNVVDVSLCQSLETLYASFGVVTTVIPPLSGSLITLGSYNNSLVTLDLSYSPLLESVDLNNTSLPTIDVSNCPNLVTLLLANAPVSSIDMSTSTLIETLSLSGTSIVNLNLSQNINITGLFVSNCTNMTDLNIANGNNTVMNSFYATGTPNLTCIQVDDVSFSTSNWVDVDATVSFSLNCNPVTNITVASQSNQYIISTNGGTLQMVTDVLPLNASDGSITWSVVNGTGAAIIDGSGLLTGTNNGTVTVIATANDSSGIEGSVEVIISNQTMASIILNEMNFDLSMYPNPTTGVVNFESSSKIELIEIYNLIGEKIAHYVNTTTININELTNGIYFVKVTNDNESKKVQKLTKK